MTDDINIPNYSGVKSSFEFLKEVLFCAQFNLLLSISIHNTQKKVTMNQSASGWHNGRPVVTTEITTSDRQNGKEKSSSVYVIPALRHETNASTPPTSYYTTARSPSIQSHNEKISPSWLTTKVHGRFHNMFDNDADAAAGVAVVKRKSHGGPSAPAITDDARNDRESGDMRPIRDPRICKHYAKGKCRFGRKCKFMHTKQHEKVDEKTHVSYFAGTLWHIHIPVPDGGPRDAPIVDLQPQQFSFPTTAVAMASMNNTPQIVRWKTLLASNTVVIVPKVNFTLAIANNTQLDVHIRPPAFTVFNLANAKSHLKPTIPVVKIMFAIFEFEMKKRKVGLIVKSCTLP